ncbi:MAG TPA: SiaB family protein kinase [Tenuifilaceae bacterium]|nr:SiaB family protein kinase [Tenuifilaceae bacterium]HPE17189.1 SiaB family protein kinase [Tenuifilaceae bacterium]HPJ44763.1 SiaB family protein kinase [Tenuifilaceae bacterium]HPQ33301.1 SiaB family protein kinase [Tenuifilaceae bacterium]HRX67588.1 SiaB family protein kinase [Tenuifilaceae bacterium]
MNIELLNTLFYDLREDDLSFAYTGSFSDSLTVKIIDLARYNIDSQGMNTGLKNKVSFIMGECYQNIVRHSVDTSTIKQFDEKSNYFFLRTIGSSFFITSANPVENDSINEIKSKLDRVNNLSPDELKELQAQILMKGELNEKGGAGIGIILMARKTGEKLLYKFEKINDKTSLFYLFVRLHVADTKAVWENDELLKRMILLHDNLAIHGVLIMHKGDFSKNTFLPVIKMIEGNLEKNFEKNFFSSNLYHLSVEILQNISRHGYKKDGVTEGVFTLGKVNDKYIIGAANLIEKSEASTLASQMNELSKLSVEQLNQLYKKRLQMVIDEVNLSIGLGLIDIYKYSQKVEFSITPHNESALFSLIVTI